MAKLTLILGDVKIELPDLIKANLAFPACHSPGGGNLTDQSPKEGAMQ